MVAGTALGRCVALLLAAGIALTALGWSGAAHAHANLIAADPANGAVIAQGPEAFSLTFNEPISPLVLKLVAPDGSVMDLPRPKVEGTTLSIPAPTEMPAGTYVLSWRVVSLDGHPVGGTIVFSFGHASAGASSGGVATVDWPVRIAIWFAKIVLYAGLFLGAGASLFRTLIAPLPAVSRTFALVASLAGLIAAVLSVGLQGLDALDAPIGAFFHAAVWGAGFSTTYGSTATLSALALVVAIFALLVKDARGAAFLSFAVAVGVGLAVAASGHASNAPPQWLTRPAVFLHAVALAFWIGALPPLALTLRRGGEGAARALARFSRLIPFAIVPLIFSGLALAFVQLRTPSALWETGYGRVLIAKLALLAALFGLAAWNRWSLTDRAKAADPPAVRSLVRSLAVETVLVVAILGVVALWRFTPPPRALSTTFVAPAEAHLHGEKAMAHLSLSPGRVGRIAASIAVFSNDGRPLAPKEVTLIVTKPDSGLEPIARSAHRKDDGMWQVDDLVVPIPGEWSARVEILVSDFEKINLEAQVQIAP